VHVECGIIGSNALFMRDCLHHLPFGFSIFERQQQGIAEDEKHHCYRHIKLKT
jgi:hypothetical protein